MKQCNIVLTEKHKKYQHYHPEKAIYIYIYIYIVGEKI